MESISGKIIIDDKIILGNLVFNNKVIKIIDDKSINSENFILPGFIDLHCHGGNGFDTMEGLESIVKLSKYHLENGTTTFFPTTVLESMADFCPITAPDFITAPLSILILVLSSTLSAITASLLIE